MSGPIHRSAIIAGDPWTLLITLEEDPDSLGCTVHRPLRLDRTDLNSTKRKWPR